MRQTAIALALIFSLAAAALAAPSSTGRSRVIVEVTTIAASTGNAQDSSRGPVVDAKLAAFAKKLRSLFAYKRYSFLMSTQSETQLGGVSAFQLPGRFSLDVEPERFESEGPGRIEMLVTLYREGRSGGGGRGRPEREIVLRTRISLENGGTVLLGGPPIGDDVLILALSARR
jgi:hypothetical protein